MICPPNAPNAERPETTMHFCLVMVDFAIAVGDAARRSPWSWDARGTAATIQDAMQGAKFVAR
jgi:hypothetical protein